jgi:PKD repeat protein
MQEQIRNGLKTIGAPLLALVLVFSLVATPVAAQSTTTVDFRTDNDATVQLAVGDTLQTTNDMASDPPEVVAYEWDLDGDGVVESTAEPGARDAPFMTYDTAGTYTATYDLLDTDGGVVTSYSITVEVGSTNTAPVANAGADQSVVAGDNVTFDASNSSDVDGDALTYSWDFDGDDAEDATGVAPTYSFATAGTYTVNLTVSDGTDSATDSLVVTVGEANTPPVIASEELDPDTNISATVDESISFDVSNSSDADSDDLTYSWDFDEDGTEDSANATATYTYDTAGTYDVSLTVSDGTDSVTETYSVVVEEASEEPVGGGSADDGISTEAILALLGTFVFAVTVGVAVRRIG